MRLEYCYGLIMWGEIGGCRLRSTAAMYDEWNRSGPTPMRRAFKQLKVRRIL